MKLGYIPRTLDQPERFFFWDMDQFIIAIAVIGLGVSFGFLGSGLVVGSITAWQYGKFKAGKHPKFALHATYWWLPSDLFMKTNIIPASENRYFLG